MGRSSYKIYENDFPYFLTSTIVDRIPLFADPEITEILLKSLEFLQDSKGVELYAYVVMENHIHLVARSNKLSEDLKRFKSFTARQFIDLLKSRGRGRVLKQLLRAKLKHKHQSKYQVWQEGFHPKQITTPEMMVQKIEYVHNNPVQRGYVDIPEHWRYSSARNYLGLKTLIPVTLYGG